MNTLTAMLVFNATMFFIFAMGQFWVVANASKYWERRQKKEYDKWLKAEAWGLLLWIELFIGNLIIIILNYGSGAQGVWL